MEGTTLSGMTHHRQRSCLVLAAAALGAASLLCATAFPAHAGAARAKPCKGKHVAIAYKPRGRTKAKAWCLPTPRIPRSQADAAVAIVRLLEQGKLSPKRLERLVGHLPAAKERAFRRSREQQVRRATTEAHGARAAQASHSQGNVAPGPGQAGFGYFTESSSSSTEEDAEHATVRKAHTSKSRHEAFGPKCPDFDGNVVTKISIVHTDVRSTERRGKRTTITTDAKISGTLTGGFTDDFEFRGPLKLDLDFVIETRVVTVIAATEKVVDRKPTATRRVKMTTSIAPEALGALELPADAFNAMTITGAGGPHGVLSLDDFIADPPLVLSIMGSVSLAKTEAAAGFAKTVDNATGFGCVVATADPAALTLANGESGSFTVTERGLDDQRALPSSNNVRVYSGNLTLSPIGNKIHGPASGIAFQATSGGGASVAEVGTVSRRGYSPTLKIPISERKGFPARFTGTWTRVYNDAAGRPGMVETINGTATFVRNPLIPPEAEATIAIPYDIQSSAITWTVTGSHTDASCTTTFSGAGTDTATPNTFVDTGMTLQDVRGNPAAPVPEPMPYYYSLRASSDPSNAPLFTITRTGGAGCTDSQEPIIVDYLELGVRADLSSGTPLDEVEKSGDITLLAGHRAHTNSGLVADDTWSFRGSN
jgi:hypothetical protein